MDWEPGVVMNDAFIAYLEASEDPDRAGGRLAAVVATADKMLLHDTRISARWLQGKLYADHARAEAAQGVWQEAIALANELDAPRMASDIQGELDALG